MSAEKAFLDTNILVYVFDRDEPAKAARATELLEEAPPGGIALSAQVLNEFYVVATNKLKRPLDSLAAARAVDWLALLEVVPLDAALVKAAIEIGRTAQISHWDALIVASAAAAGCTLLLTEELNDGQTIASVRVENPFRAVSR
jgi:predicted nucleic acid-binding protein